MFESKSLTFIGPLCNQPSADTGSSHILLRETDAAQLSNVRHDSDIRVALPNGDTICSSSAGDLWLPHLPTPLTVHIFPDTKLDTSLISISELCNNGFIATFSSEDVHVTKDGLTVLHHGKDKSDHLWNVQLVAPTDATSASAILRSDTDVAFATFIQTALGSPVLSTLLRAVRKGYLASYPRSTANMVTSYLSLTAATPRGHLDQHRQGLDSTSTDEQSNDSEEVDHPPLPCGKAVHALSNNLTPFSSLRILTA